MLPARVALRIEGAHAAARREVLSGLFASQGTVVALGLVIAAVCALLGIVYALIRSSSYVESIAFALAVDGATVYLVAAMAGSPSQRTAQSPILYLVAI